MKHDYQLGWIDPRTLGSEELIALWNRLHPENPYTARDAELTRIMNKAIVRLRLLHRLQNFWVPLLVGLSLGHSIGEILRAL